MCCIIALCLLFRVSFIVPCDRNVFLGAGHSAVTLTPVPASSRATSPRRRSLPEDRTASRWTKFSS